MDVDYDSPQPQMGQLETVTRKQLSIVDGEEPFKAITETQERIQADLRSYEKKP